MNFKMADDHHIRHALPYVACTQGYHDIPSFLEYQLNVY